MERQRQIKRTLAAPESIAVVRQLLADGAHSNRSALTAAKCEHFGFVDALGRAQIAGCFKGLRELEHAGHFALPPAGPEVAARASAGLRGAWTRPYPSRTMCPRRPARCKA